MSSQPVIDRARADLAAGRAWKARDRLQGARASRPHDQEILGLLGDVAWAMDDHPAAGAAWWLTQRSGPDVDAAYLALYERAGNDPAQLLRMIKPAPPATRYPEAVVQRVQWLVRDAEPWDRYQWLFEERPVRERPEEGEWEETWRDTLAGAFVFTVFALPWFAGVVALVGAVVWLITTRA